MWHHHAKVYPVRLTEAEDHAVDVCLVLKQRMEELGLEQRELAAAAEVTESYISQLLTRKKLPPAPDRTDIYDKMGRFVYSCGGSERKQPLPSLLRREVAQALNDPALVI